MLAARVAIALSLLTFTGHIAQLGSPAGRDGGSAGIIAAFFPDAAVHVKPPPRREGLRFERDLHIPFPPSLDPAAALIEGPVPPSTLRPEVIHGGARRSPLHRDIALRAPPLAGWVD